MRQYVLSLFWVAGSIAALAFNGPPVQAGLISREVNVTLSAANFETYDLDLDLNGTTDFTFTAAYAPDPSLAVGFDTIDFAFGSNNAAVIDSATGDGFPSVTRLNVGDTISSGSTFSGPNDQGNLYFFISTDLPPTTGNFGGQTGFVGLRFDTPGGINFGFAQVSVKDLGDPSNPFDLTIGTVGYNDVAGQAAAVAVPEPASVAILAFGGFVFATSRWRDHRKKLTA